MSHFIVSFSAASVSRQVAIEYVLKSESRSWWSYFPSFYIICTDKSLAHWNSTLQCLIDDDTDTFIILTVNLSSPRNGWLPKDAWDWLNSHHK